MFNSPRIAPNTGNAIRMVAATGCELHLVEPLGFDLSEPKLRRAGLDYHDLASVTVHADLPAAWDGGDAGAGVRVHRARRQSFFADVDYRARRRAAVRPGTDRPGRRRRWPTRTSPRSVRIPMLAGRRSLNLSNAAAVAVYEAWRQQGFSRRGLSRRYQVFQWLSCSAGSRLAVLKSVPLV